jgi:hypothetical protein
MNAPRDVSYDDTLSIALKDPVEAAAYIEAVMAVKDESGAIKDYSVPSKMAREGVRMTSDLPTFKMPARPTDVPQWLRDLPSDAGVTYIDNVGGGRSITGPVYAKDVIEIVEAAMKRHATGFFILNEAAQILADMKGADVKGLKQKMLLAFQASLLPIRDPSDNGKLASNAKVRDFYNLVTIEDLDTWLNSTGMGYQFPKADELQKSEVAVSTKQRPIQRTTAQNDAILEAIKAKGYEPSSLPKAKPGKSGVKAEIRAATVNNPLFQGTVFNKAWERLRSAGEIADAI